ncbi:MAG: (2Fe-2S) ferredoxin domain-containing protein [Burkholderiaceae bacterium]
MPQRFKHHIFICTNHRDDGESCAARGSLALLKSMKEAVRDHQSDHEGGIMVNKSGCFGLCQQGPNCVVYPQSTWHSIKTPGEARALIDALHSPTGCPSQN